MPALTCSLETIKHRDCGEEATHRLVRLLMPSLVVPYSKLELRQFEGIVPEKRFWLAFRVCSWFKEAHSGGSEPVRVLLLKLTCFRLELPDHEAGMEPASRHRRGSEILQIITRFE